MEAKVILEAKSLKKYYHRGSEIVKALDGWILKLWRGKLFQLLADLVLGRLL